MSADSLTHHRVGFSRGASQLIIRLDHLSQKHRKHASNVLTMEVRPPWSEWRYDLVDQSTRAESGPEQKNDRFTEHMAYYLSFVLSKSG